MAYKRNERDWAGQLVSWIKTAIDKQTTVFQDVTNDTSVKSADGRTKFPDILLFLDKVSGVVFNGWELKFPDTPVDDAQMLNNAIEKAKILHSNSFVTWNGAEAVIWGIDTEEYSIGSLTKLKIYPKDPSISSRAALSDPQQYFIHEAALKQRAVEILHDLDMLFRNGKLKPAINISGNIVAAIEAASRVVVPQFRLAIEDRKGSDRRFREAFSKWKIYEGATLRILQSSSRRAEQVVPEIILAKFAFYNLIGKILFYLTLCDNYSGKIEPLAINQGSDVKAQLTHYFEAASKIDYKAIFKPYFTDDIAFSHIVDTAIIGLLHTLAQFDFKVLPSGVIGTILENLVPAEEKQKFGQYFTPELLATMVAFPVVQTRNDILFDPTCGTGTFLNSFYMLLQYYGCSGHSNLLSHIWGNDISHFPAILSVINMYKHDVTAIDNFPRIVRDNFFNLEVGQNVVFPDANNSNSPKNVPIPLFDGIASNFPFIQQEDVPNEFLSDFFKNKFNQSQPALLKDGNFKINERSDYFTFCIYNSLRFLKPHGRLAAITSNAWLGKEYGIQFKKFLLDNFHIKYVVRSSAEHWFSDSQVSTIYFVVERENIQYPTRFVTINKKLGDLIAANDLNTQLQEIEELYAEIDNCDDDNNAGWESDAVFDGRYTKNDGSTTVVIVPRHTLTDSTVTATNWDEYFISPDLFGPLRPCLTQYYPKVVDVFRGERTGWNDMFVVRERDVASSGISQDYLMPYVKSPDELAAIKFSNDYGFRLFVCNDSISEVDSGTLAWISKFENAKNKNGSLTIQQACRGHKPYWYSLRPKKAQIITAINPFERFLFTFSDTPFAIDQRLIAMSVKPGYDVELVAALLNSAVTFLIMEICGTSRYLGALDLNANYLKQFCSLNPDLLSESQKLEILGAFAPLQNRPIRNIFDEIRMPDRIAFDETVFRCYRLDRQLLFNIYDLLASLVSVRVSLRKK